jgi:hypothetical protein
MGTCNKGEEPLKQVNLFGVEVHKVKGVIQRIRHPILFQYRCCKS